MTLFGRSLARLCWAVKRDPAVHTISYLSGPGKTVCVIGTAHVSSASASEVIRVIDRINPSAVMLELCEARTRRIRSKDPPPSAHTLWAPLISHISSGNFRAAGDVALRMGVCGMYAYFEHLGAKPGAEFHEAIELCDSRGIPLILGDRDVEDTLRELQPAIMDDLPGLLGLSGGPAGSHSGYSEIGSKGMTNIMTKEAIKKRIGLGRPGIDWRTLIENMKDRETASALIQKMRLRAPKVHEIIVSKRDIYLANAIIQAKYSNIVAVVGMAHMDGIEALWLKQNDK